MEYIQGPTLLSLLETQPDNTMSEMRAKWYVRQVLQALKYLHGLGIKHGDVTLENILLNTETDQIKIADFGYADKMSFGGHFETVMGTPMYMAPEIYAKKYDT